MIACRSVASPWVFARSARDTFKRLDRCGGITSAVWHCFAPRGAGVECVMICNLKALALATGAVLSVATSSFFSCRVTTPTLFSSAGDHWRTSCCPEDPAIRGVCRSGRGAHPASSLACLQPLRNGTYRRLLLERQSRGLSDILHVNMSRLLPSGHHVFAQTRAKCQIGAHENRSKSAARTVRDFVKSLSPT